MSGTRLLHGIGSPEDLRRLPREQVEQVADIVMKAIDRGTPEVYAPGMWRLVMLVIRNLPRLVMRRIGF